MTPDDYPIVMRNGCHASSRCWRPDQDRHGFRGRKDAKTLLRSYAGATQQRKAANVLESLRISE